MRVQFFVVVCLVFLLKPSIISKLCKYLMIWLRQHLWVVGVGGVVEGGITTSSHPFFTAALRTQCPFVCIRDFLTLKLSIASGGVREHANCIAPHPYISSCPPPSPSSYSFLSLPPPFLFLSGRSTTVTHGIVEVYPFFLFTYYYDTITININKTLSIIPPPPWP